MKWSTYFGNIQWKSWYRVLIVSMVFTVAVLIGMFTVASYEDWNYDDSFYFMVNASTALGFGDFVPKTTTMKMFLSFWLTLSNILYLLLAGLVGYALIERCPPDKVESS